MEFSILGISIMGIITNGFWISLTELVDIHAQLLKNYLQIRQQVCEVSLLVFAPLLFFFPNFWENEQNG